jgi:hypothetical protein
MDLRRGGGLGERARRSEKRRVGIVMRAEKVGEDGFEVHPRMAVFTEREIV